VKSESDEFLRPEIVLKSRDLTVCWKTRFWVAQRFQRCDKRALFKGFSPRSCWHEFLSKLLSRAASHAESLAAQPLVITGPEHLPQTGAATTIVVEKNSHS